MTLRVFLLSFILLGSSSLAWSIKATTAYTVFYKKDNKDSNQYHANILLTWRVENSSMHFKKNADNKFEGEVVCFLRWSNDTAIVKQETFIIKSNPKASLQEAIDEAIADQYEYNFPEGHYELEFVLFEKEYKEQLYQFYDTVTITAPINDAPFLSGIQLLDTFVRATASPTIYDRNGYIDMPLTNNYLGENRSAICYYYELYNAHKSVKNSEPIKISSYVSWKPYAAPVPLFEKVDTIQPYQYIQSFHKVFSLEELKSGNYYLNIVLSDKNNTVLEKKTLFFQRYNKNVVAAAKPKLNNDSLKNIDDTTGTHILDLTNTFVGKYTASQVRSILKMLLLICEPDEGITINGFLKKPDELYSKFFIYNFWEKRNKLNPDKAWKEYTERIKEVNRLFKGAGQSGFETDRGRIYIQYGKPNERVIVNNESGALPYEIWQYYNTEKQGQEGVFLFYNPAQSLGGYVLLHSTLAGERRNSNWRTLLYNNTINGSGALNPDSQAEQYIKNR